MKRKTFKSILFVTLCLLTFSFLVSFNTSIVAFAHDGDENREIFSNEQVQAIEYGHEEISMEPNFVVVPPIDGIGFNLEATSGLGCSDLAVPDAKKDIHQII